MDKYKSSVEGKPFSLLGQAGSEAVAQQGCAGSVLGGSGTCLEKALSCLV